MVIEALEMTKIQIKLVKFVLVCAPFQDNRCLLIHVVPKVAEG